MRPSTAGREGGENQDRRYERVLSSPDIAKLRPSDHKTYFVLQRHVRYLNP